MLRKILLLAVTLFTLIPQTVFSDNSHSARESQLSISGSYKNLLSASETLAYEGYWNDLNRLRLEVDLNLNSSTHIKISLDNELQIGSFHDKTYDKETLLDLDWNITDNPDLYWQQSLYRLHLTHSAPNFNITAGRQRVAWGTGLIWNPADLFHPASPLSVESSNRTGVDALNLEYFFGALKSFSLVIAPREERGKGSAAARIKTNLEGYDLSLILGEFRSDKVIGFDFAGEIMDSGLRGELTVTDPEDDDGFIRLLLSWDYTFRSSLYLLFEYLHNGGNLGEGASTASLTTFTGELVTKKSNLLASGAGYDLTPLIRLGSTMIFDLDYGGIFWAPSIKYNILPEMDWTVGGLLFAGDEGSEFSGLPDAGYTSIEWYF